MKRVAAGAVGLMGLAVTASARAAGEQGEPIALHWTAPPGCPREDEVRAEIGRVLGGEPDPGARRYLRAEVRVSRSGDAFHVHLITDLGGVIGERDLDGPTCRAVANAAAVIVALTFDPGALARRADAAAPASPPTPFPISATLPSCTSSARGASPRGRSPVESSR